jgi:hypothetical protein
MLVMIIWKRTRREREIEKQKFFYKKGGEAHVGKERDSDESSSNDDDEDIVTLATNKGILFPTSTTSASCPKKARRRYTKYLLLSALPLIMNQMMI